MDFLGSQSSILCILLYLYLSATYVVLKMSMLNKRERQIQVPYIQYSFVSRVLFLYQLTAANIWYILVACM